MVPSPWLTNKFLVCLGWQGGGVEVSFFTLHFTWFGRHAVDLHIAAWVFCFGRHHKPYLNFTIAPSFFAF